jgi:hypothetical protein
LNVKEQKNDSIDGINEKADKKDSPRTDQKDLPLVQDNQDQSSAKVDDKKDEVINQQDNQEQLQEQKNNVDEPTVQLNMEQQGQNPQDDNQNKSEDKTPVVPEVKAPDNTTEENNNVISNQKQIQSNVIQGQENNIQINDSNPAIQQNNNKTVANKPRVSNEKRKMGDVQSRVLKYSSLKEDGSRKIEKLAVTNADGYLKGSESSKAAFQEVAMWGSVQDIELLKNKSNPTKSEEKSFYEKLTKAREDYLKNDVYYLHQRDWLNTLLTLQILQFDATNFHLYK